MRCRGIRGATTVEANAREDILNRAKELLQKMIETNNIDVEEIAFVFFTTTSDLDAEFPAVAARQLGWDEVALLCGHEMNVPDSLARCLRILILVNTEKEAGEIVHVYIRGTEILRQESKTWEEKA